MFAQNSRGEDDSHLWYKFSASRISSGISFPNMKLFTAVWFLSFQILIDGNLFFTLSMFPDNQRMSLLAVEVLHENHLDRVKHSWNVVANTLDFYRHPGDYRAERHARVFCQRA